MNNYLLYMSGARNQQFYIKPETSGIHLKNLNLNIDGGLTVNGVTTTNLSTTGTIFASNLIYNTGNNNISGTLTANNLVYNTGSQTISGVKIFANDINISGTGSFNGLNLDNINSLTLSGMNINITGNSTVNVFNPIRISGDQVVTKSGPANQEVIKIDQISGGVGGLRLFTPNSFFGVDILLQAGGGTIYPGSVSLRDGGVGSAVATDGSNFIVNRTGNVDYIFLVRKSGSQDSIRATNNSVNINNLLTVSGNPVLTGIPDGAWASQAEINSLSGNVVFLTGDQTISGIKTFIGNHIISGNVNITGHLSAASKSFLIDHPTQAGKKLQYGSLEGPEHGVFVRGKTNDNIITLPDYWSVLVDENSISVNLTPINVSNNIYVVDYNNQRVVTNGNNGNDYFYTVYGERKDIPKLTVEF